MIYKSPDCETQLEASPKELQEVAHLFDVLSSDFFGIDAVVTRVWDAVPGDSGVHEAKRAVDFRDSHAGKCLYSADQTLRLVNALNAFYPRKDGKPTCLHHSFQGGEPHFHIQVPA